MSYFKGLNELSDYERNRLPPILLEWRSTTRHGNRYVSNLENEVFLPPQYMRLLLKDIIRYYDNHHNTSNNKKQLFENIKKELSQKFYSYYRRRGGRVSGISAELIGTVLPWERFVNYILVNVGYPFDNETDVWKAMREFKKYNYLDPALENRLVKNHDWLVWFTWDEGNRKGAPFSFVNHGREELVTALGLGGKPYNRKLISFSFLYYLTPYKCRLRKPTFCDADFSIYFRPANGGDHGMTNPLNDGFLKNGQRATSRPEAVEKSNFFTLNRLYNFKQHP